jgi:hypothetical protein
MPVRGNTIEVNCTAHHNPKTEAKTEYTETIDKGLKDSYQLCPFLEENHFEIKKQSVSQGPEDCGQQTSTCKARTMRTLSKNGTRR